jgi:high-affinity nickel-transport protein
MVERPKSDSAVPLHGLSRSEETEIILLYIPIIAATIIGFVASTVIGSKYVVLASYGVVAFVFGLRHGVDADHIAAIDNTTRKLMQEGKKPLAVGTWFSLGHSTIVVGLIVALVISARTVAGSIPALKAMGTVLGTAISGSFLWMLGLINVVVAIGIYHIYKKVRAGRMNPDELDDLLNKRGFMNRYFSSVFRIIKKPWQIYPVGVLFGLGFDTASEVALIAISVGVGLQSSVPLWMILVLPFMFTCGMVLVDTTDGVAMRMAYGWAFRKPARKIYYNLTITVISVLVAFLIGSIELLQVLAQELNLTGSFWSWMKLLNFESLGYGIIAIFMLSWAVSVIVYKLKKIE